MKTTAGALTRDHLGGEVVIRMGRDRIAGIVKQVAHFPASVTVHIDSEHGFSVCCLDVDSPVEVAE